MRVDPNERYPFERARERDEGPVGAPERDAQGLDGAPVLLAVRREPREVVVEGGVDHGVRPRRSGAKAVEILEVAAMRLRTGRRKGLRAGIGSRQAQDLVSGRQQLGYDARADEAGRAREKYPHETLSDVGRSGMSP